MLRVIDIFLQTGRMLLARWPVLLPIFLGGWLAHYLLIQLAGQVGAYTAIGGFLILPLAALARVLSFVAMFLVLRDRMPGYQSILASGDDAVDRTGGRAGGTRAFLDVTLGAILPFFLFYAAWQFLQDDVTDYAGIALGELTNRIFAEDDLDRSGTVLDIGVSWLSIAIVIVAYAGRFLLKRYAARLPRWTSVVAVYLEAVWIYFLLFLARDWIDAARAWIDGRQGMVWLGDVRQWFADTLAPVTWIWDGVSWLISEAGAVVLLPLAWLTLAGVVLGRALSRASTTVRFRDARIRAVQDRFAALPEPISRRLRELGADFVERWKPLVDALVLMWRAGPIPLALFVLGYLVIDAATQWSLRAVALLIGPREMTFWFAFDELIGFAVVLLWEPLRITLIAAAYDFCLARLEQRREAATVAADTATAR